MNLRDKLMIYIVRKMNSIENEREELRQNIRYRPIDNLDIYEYLLNDMRCQIWNEFTTDLLRVITAGDRNDITKK